MRNRLLHALLPVFFLVLTHVLKAQCTDFVNDPFPLSFHADCDSTEVNAIPVMQANGYFLPQLTGGVEYEISICNSGYPLPPNQMELVIVNTLNFEVVAFTFDCVIQFSAPQSGDYFFIFNESGNCGSPGSASGPGGIEVTQFCACNLDRLAAVDFILGPESGVNFSAANSNLFLPFLDFGLGFGFEGAIPAGSTVRDIFGSIELVMPFDGYLFYQDLAPPLEFGHQTLFIGVDINDCTPTISEGSLIFADALSWPILEIPPNPEIELFGPDIVSEDPPGPANPDGVVAGEVPHPDSVEVEENPPANNSMSNSAGVVVAGDSSGRITGNIPRWRDELQDDHGVDSSRILGTATNGAVTIDSLCILLDSLCTLNPAPDTIYIRIASHGKIDSLCFPDGKLGKNELCQKIKNVAKKGVPVMLTINACNSGSLLDANNWNLPAGSMVSVSAASGLSSFGWFNVSLADSNGNAVPGTSFTGSIFPQAVIDCKRDTTDSDDDGKTDADSNEDGNVDDCEAFNWVDSQKPCYVANRGPYNFGTHVVNKWVFYPAGPPAPINDPDSVFAGGVVKDGAIIWGPDPMPSYRAVGNFGSSMNFNVQNNSGGTKNTFYMVFSGDVSGGIGAAWNSNSQDSLMGTWSSTFDITSTYDAGTDETTVCWMASGDPAAQDSFVHFGYVSPAGQKLRPKRQYWTDTPEGENTPDADKVPATESSILLDGSGSPLTVTTVNLGTSAGGWGEPVNYTIGYRIAPDSIPLENLALADSMISPLTYHAAGTGALDTNDLYEFTLDVPDDIRAGDVFILQVELDWALNSNTSMTLLQWPVLEPSICEDDITFVSGDTIPQQVNSDGIITLESGVIFKAGITTLNATGGVTTASGTVEVPTGSEVHIYDFGCGVTSQGGSSSLLFNTPVEIWQEERQIHKSRRDNGHRE